MSYVYLRDCGLVCDVPYVVTCNKISETGTYPVILTWASTSSQVSDVVQEQNTNTLTFLQVPSSFGFLSSSHSRLDGFA